MLYLQRWQLYCWLSRQYSRAEREFVFRTFGVAERQVGYGPGSQVIDSRQTSYQTTAPQVDSGPGNTIIEHYLSNCDLCYELNW